jgi:hypothetical protein
VTAGVDQTINAVRDRQDAEAPRTATQRALGALGDQRDIARAGAEIEGAVGRDEAAAYKAQADADAAAEKVRNAERERWKTEMDAARADLKSAQDAYVNHKVDQNRAWHSKSTGQKVLAGIGVALAGLGGALVARDTGRPVTNPALDMIMGAIQDDVRLQLAERDKLGAVAGMKRDAVGDLRQRYGDEEAAFQAIVAGNLRRTENQVKGIAAQAKDPKAKLAMENLSADLGLKAAEVEQAATDRELAQKNADRSYRLQAAGQALANKQFERGKYEFDVQMDQRYTEMMLKAKEAEAKGKVEEAKAMREEAKEQRELAIGGFDGAPLKQKDGTPFKAPDTHAAERLRKVEQSGKQAIRIVDSIKRLRKESGAEWGNTEAGRQLKADMAALQLEIKNNAELGVLAGPDMDIIASYIGTGDATEFDTYGSLEKGLDRVRGNLAAKTLGTLRTGGYTGEWNPPDMSKVGMSKTPEEEKKLQSAQVVATGQSPGLVNALTPEHERTVKALGGKDAPEAQAYIRRVQGGYTEQQEATINTIANAAAATKSDEEKARLIGQLESIMNADSAPPGLRQYASEARYAISAGTYKPRSTYAMKPQGFLNKVGRKLRNESEGIFR